MSQQLEDRVAEAEGHHHDPYKRMQKVKESAHYKKLQQQLAEKREKEVTEVDQKPGVSVRTDARKSGAQKPKLKHLFQWEKNKEGELCIKTKLKSDSFLSIPAEKGASKIMNFLGYKIDISSKRESYIEQYQKLFIDSKSHNFLLAKYAQLKFGMIQAVLSVLGVSTEDLQDLQKKAVKASREENENLFAQNEYNYEMLTIFSTAKKDKGRLKVLDELRSQLMLQMEKLGEPSYYTKERTLYTKQKEVKKILQELIQEKNNLEYLRNYQ